MEAAYIDAGWFDTARQRFQEADEYPLIDYQEIIDRAAIWNYWPSDYGKTAKPDQLFQAALTSDHHELSVRFVWLSFFFSLGHYPAEEVLQVVYEQQEAPGHRRQFLEYRKSLVTLVDVDECKDPRHIRWEIVNASAIQDWSRQTGCTTVWRRWRLRPRSTNFGHCGAGTMRYQFSPARGNWTGWIGGHAVAKRG